MCPICRGIETVKWTAKREAELLPVSCFLLTFTIPKQLQLLFLSNKQFCYNLLFKAVGKTLVKCVESGNRYFNGKAGFFCVLHTHDQRVNHHPHIHTVIPAGALSNDNTSWNHSHPSFFLPVRKLSSIFRDRLVFSLKKHVKTGKLVIPASIRDIHSLLEKLKTVPWVVHCQAPSKKQSSPFHIVRYLSRYVYKTEIISEMLFLKRLAFHILPKGFKKVRFYGFMANRFRKDMLTLCRMLLGTPLAFQRETSELVNDTAFLFWKYFQVDITLCPDCGVGHLFLKIIYPDGGG